MSNVATINFVVPALVLVLSGLFYLLADHTKYPKTVELARLSYVTACLVVLIHLAQATLVVTHT